MRQGRHEEVGRIRRAWMDLPWIERRVFAGVMLGLALANFFLGNPALGVLCLGVYLWTLI